MGSWAHRYNPWKVDEGLGSGCGPRGKLMRQSYLTYGTRSAHREIYLLRLVIDPSDGPFSSERDRVLNPSAKVD